MLEIEDHLQSQFLESDFFSTLHEYIALNFWIFQFMSKVANIHTESYCNHKSRALGHLGVHNRC